MGTAIGVGIGVGIGGSSSSWKSYWKSLIELNRNNNLVCVNSIRNVSNSTNYLLTTADGNSILSVYKTDRIRQSGEIVKVDLAKINTLDGVSEVKVVIWRKIGTMYDVISRSENILPKLIAGLNTVTFDNPLVAQEGDYIGLYLKGDTSSVIAYDIIPNASKYTDAAVNDEDYDWDSATDLNALSTSHYYMRAPLICCIGDSIMESYPYHQSYIDPNPTDNILKCWTTLLSGYDFRIVCQNLGYGAQTSTTILARFDSQVIAAKPRVCFLEAGLNGYSTETKAQYIANMKSMIDKCITAKIFPIVSTIGPAGTLDTIKSQEYDARNTDLIALVQTYPKAILYDSRASFGTFRTGGDICNKWDLRTRYDSGDKVHYSEAGNQRLADDIYEIMLNPYSWTDYWAHRCPELIAYVNSLSAPLSEAKATRIGIAMMELKSLLGLTNLSDAFLFIYGFANETSEAAYKNIVKRSHDIIPHGGTFLANVGWAGNGEDAYLDTNCNPSIHGGAVYTQNNASLGIFINTDVVETKCDIGFRTGANNYSMMISRISGDKNASRMHNDLSTVIGGVVTSSIGQFIVERNAAAATGLFGFKDASSIARSSSGTDSAAIPNCNIYIGARSYNNVAELFSTRQYRYAFAGKYFTPEEVTIINEVLRNCFTN